MSRAWILRIACAIACVLAGNLAPRAYESIRAAETRGWREKVAVKAIGDEIPLEVLRPIHGSKFSVSQILAIIETESSGNPKAKSDKGAIGLMQVMPSHAVEMGYAIDDLFDPYINVVVGVHVLEKKFAKPLKWKEYHYVSAWNCGLTRWRKALAAKRSPPGETVLHWRRYRKTKHQLDNWLERGEPWESL